MTTVESNNKCPGCGATVAAVWNGYVWAAGCTNKQCNVNEEEISGGFCPDDQQNAIENWIELAEWNLEKRGR